MNIVTPTHLTKEQRLLFMQLAEINQQEDESQERNLFEKVKDIFG